MSDRLTYPENWTEKDRTALDALFAQARYEDKWFWSSYQNLWFSPDELQEHQENGRFLWGAGNWKLRDPKEYLEEAQVRIQTAQVEANYILKRINRK